MMIVYISQKKQIFSRDLKYRMVGGLAHWDWEVGPLSGDNVKTTVGE